MTAHLSFFPVGNGDMTLVETEDGHRILIDVNIRSAADDPDDDTPNVVAKLRKKLVRDAAGRLCLDALLVSHPDQDHCRGLRKHFHLGPPDAWSKSEDKILVCEIWSSPMVFRRASRRHVLCDDANAFNDEARPARTRVPGHARKVGDGDRILILGEDEDGKTDDLKQILVPVDHQFSQVNGQRDDSITALLLALLPTDTDDDEDILSKCGVLCLRNNSRTDGKMTAGTLSRAAASAPPAIHSVSACCFSRGDGAMMNDALQVVHPRAAGLEVHKVETTARVYRDPSTHDEALMVNRNASRWLKHDSAVLPGRQQDRRQVPVSHRRGCRGRDLGKALESPSPPRGMVVL